MTEQGGAVIVLASFMMDLVARVPRRPRAGESVIGSDFGMFVGGKGNNQALAAARAGAAVRVIGRVGDDLFGPPFFEKLRDAGVDATHVLRDTAAGTGVAMPLIEPDGQNSIVIIPRANGRVDAAQVRAAAAAFAGAAVALAQLEVPLEAVTAAFEIARAEGARTVLNPAPVPDRAPSLDGGWLTLVDVLIPNESEAEALTGIAVHDLASAEEAARAFLAAGCGSVVVTLGSRGALWAPGRDEAAVFLPPFPVRQVDATAAGDAFCGTLAAALANGMATREALRRASAAGALAATKLGAEPSLPTRVEVDALLARQGRRDEQDPPIPG